jgi:hypothetical protein
MDKKRCGFEGCDRKYEAKGWCKPHYNQLARGAELTPIGKRGISGGRPKGSRSGSIEEFFWARVEKSPGCWTWTGAQSTLGYGSLKYPGIVVGAHRFSYELLVGPISEGGVIDHLCHNSSCVNPEHLRVASHTQNMQNRLGAHSNSKSGVRGVYWEHKTGKWRVGVTANGKKHTIGRFSTIEEAETAAKNARLELHS